MWTIQPGVASGDTPEPLFETPFGRFRLDRLPYRKREPLRAWDAADEYLLNHLAEHARPAAGCRILTVNDGFGALAVALSEFEPTLWSDSYLSVEAARRNLAANGLPRHAVNVLTSLDTPSGFYDRVLIKIPKTQALLEDELLRLKPQLRSDSLIIAAGMVKSLPPSVRGLFEKILGPTDLSLAQKKARLLFVTYDDRLPQPKNPYPVEYRLEGTEFSILNHANVFSRDRLDIGTRFLLQHMPHRPDATDIVDLGCGNGILGLIAARDHPLATVHFADESYMAVASARRNFETAFGTERRATFCVGDCLEGFSKDSADLVLCNPPFHQQTAIGDAVARKMFKQARNILRPGGELRVVGNRHLGYHRLLQQGFERVEVAAANAKFVILSATA